MNDDLTDIVNGDAHRARVLRQNLARIAEGPDPILREMATSVLNGQVRLRDAATSNVYADALTDNFTQFWTTFQDMTPEERDALTTQGHQHIERAS